MSKTPVDEYLIKAEDGSPLIVDGSILHAPGYSLERVDGWGDYRVRCGDSEIAFSYEDVGIHMTIDGPQSAFDSDRLAEDIRAAVEGATGRVIVLRPL